MNKILKAFTMCGVLLVAMSLMAETEMVDGIEWTYTVLNGKALIGSGGGCAVSDTTTGLIAIPAYLGGHKVVGIGAYAFHDCRLLTQVEIPDSVTSIGEDAFCGCSKLSNVSIPNSVTNIGYSAFQGCSNLIEMTIPDSVVFLGGYAFMACHSLKRMTIGNGVERILTETFNSCKSLEHVTIGSSVTRIGDFAFNDCWNLLDITIPDCVTGIGKSAFMGCGRLAEVTVGNGVSVIGEAAFKECRGLVKVTMGNGVRTVEAAAFDSCTQLRQVHITDLEVWCRIVFDGYSSNPFFWAGNLYLNDELLTDIIVTDGVTRINPYAFYTGWVDGSRSAITNVVIPASVRCIGDRAFWGCKALTTLSIDEGVDNIGQESFQGCIALERIDIPESVTNIGYAAFSNCGLTHATIGNGTRTIGSIAFGSCTSLVSLVIGNNVTNIGNMAFAWCGALECITIPSSVESIRDRAFYSCGNLTSVTFMGNAPMVGDEAFGGVSPACIIKVSRNSTGWGVEIPGMWNGCAIEYADEASWPREYVVDASITGGKAICVNEEWITTELDQRFGAGRKEAFVAKFGSDFAAALTRNTGKVDDAGNALSVWHDFVAGTDPTDVNSTFKAKIQMRDGVPVIEWEPNLNESGEVRTYTVYGKAELKDGWHSPTNALDRFFKVDVAMPYDGTVTFNVGEGSPIDSATIRVGQPIGELPTPTRQGYDFLGWFTEAGGGSAITPETIVTDDLTIYAHWERNVNADLVHRWSFNGDLTDSVGGQTATTVGGVTTDGNVYTTPGGSSGSAYIDLGNWILPTNGSPITIELWVKQDSWVNYGRIYCWGAMPTEGKFSNYGYYANASEWLQMHWDGTVSAWTDNAQLDSLSVGVEYHVATVIEPLGNGTCKVTFYQQNASTGATLSSGCVTTKSGWNLQNWQQTDMVLGQTLTTWDDCAKNSYNELRIWKKAMTEDELTASAIAGPDADL